MLVLSYFAESQLLGGYVSDAKHGAEIRLENLTKSYPGNPIPAVDNFNITIPAGELVVFVGPSGCGKTTTMKMINRIIEPTSGRIYIGGKDVTESPADELRRGIGYVIQQIGLFPHHTIAENVATVPKLLGWEKDRVAVRVHELLELVGLNPARYSNRYPKQLSGGQQQRVGVARALAADPAVLLMDEPFGATDPITRVRLQKEFKSLQQELGKTVVFVTHDFEEALLLGDRIAVLAEGSKLEQYGTPIELLSAPANEHVESFVGDAARVRMLSLIDLSDVVVHSGEKDGHTLSEDRSLREAMDAFIEGANYVNITSGGKVKGHISFTDLQGSIREMQASVHKK